MQEEAVQSLLSLTSPNFNDYNHLVNVGIYGLSLLKEILKEAKDLDLTEIATGLFVHDIGYFDIPKEITQKDGKLTNEEWATIKKHPEKGAKLMKDMGLLSDDIEKIIMQHHERHDGSGYPLGLKGDQIHTYSKICSIADMFDALTSNRPYRYAQKSFRALQM